MARRFKCRWTVLFGVGVLPACVVEQIDALIAERGITDCSETTAVADTASSSTGMGESGGSTLSDTTLVGSSSTGDTGSSSGESSSSGASSSSEPGPLCGDGVVDGDETCDDMNDVPDDGCHACARDSIVFVTSELYQGDVNGLAGADQRCRMLAAIAGLPRFETYRAWLSSSTISAGERLIHSRGRYVLVNGLVVAQDWEGLVSGTLERPIDVDENSQTQVSRAWTGTRFDGSAAPGASFCADWTESSGPEGGTGLIGTTDATWSFFENIDCGVQIHLYCVEQ